MNDKSELMEMSEIVENISDHKINQIPPPFENDLTRRIRLLEAEDKVNNNYESCCCPGTTDKRLVILGSQIGLSVLVIIFAFYKLSDDNENNDEQLYMPLLSSVLSYWFGRSSNSGDSYRR